MAKKPTKGAYTKAAVFIDRKPTTRNTRFKAGALVDVMNKINTDGLALLANHNSSQFPIGMWYKAKVNENEQVIAEFYVPKEISEFADVSARIESGILDSVSIGFSAGTHDCSICGNDIQDYENCPHIPGKTYDNEIAYVELDGIKASEGSLVYSGAVPAAKIQDSYSEDSTKEDYCKSHNFDEGELMIATGGLLLQDNDETFTEGIEMELQEKFDNLTTKFSDISGKYTALLEKFNANSTDLGKIEGYKTEAEDSKKLAETAKEAYATVIETVTAQVTALAAPHDAKYEAPTDIESLFADMENFMELTKALPAGQQLKSEEDGAVAYVVPEDHFKV